MKPCIKCPGVVEPLYEKYGNICRKCRSAIQTERNRKNPSVPRAAGARYRATNPNYPKQQRVLNWRQQGIELTYAAYEAKLAGQGGRCAICRTPEAGQKRAFHVDHDHDFGHVRGLLCAVCNRALGGFKDSPALLRAAAKYIEKHSPRLKLTAKGT